MTNISVIDKANTFFTEDSGSAPQRKEIPRIYYNSVAGKKFRSGLILLIIAQPCNGGVTNNSKKCETKIIKTCFHYRTAGRSNQLQGNRNNQVGGRIMRATELSSAKPCTEIRCYSGPVARELFILCRPDPLETDITGQTTSIYRSLDRVLQHEKASGEYVLQERVFFRNIQRDLPAFCAVRNSAFPMYAPASTFVQQPPINGQNSIEILAYALIPHGNSTRVNPGFKAQPEVSGYALATDESKHTFFANIYGKPGDSEEESHSMFQSAEMLLRQEQMSFRDVVRTWIYLRYIDRDYSGFNQGRTKFFRQQGLQLLPASTGIEGVPPSESQAMCLSLYAIQSPKPIGMKPMSAPTLNEAWTYGADFSRGLKVAGANAITLFISGTASVDEKGRTAHPDNFEAQADRMVMNISSLLAQQNASFQDIVSAVTYIKNPADASLISKVFEKRGVGTFPNATVQARICRPNLLCEMEAIAILALS